MTITKKDVDQKINDFFNEFQHKINSSSEDLDYIFSQRDMMKGRLYTLYSFKLITFIEFESLNESLWYKVESILGKRG